MSGTFFREKRRERRPVVAYTAKNKRKRRPYVWRTCQSRLIAKEGRISIREPISRDIWRRQSERGLQWNFGDSDTRVFFSMHNSHYLGSSTCSCQIWVDLKNYLWDSDRKFFIGRIKNDKAQVGPCCYSIPWKLQTHRFIRMLAFASLCVANSHRYHQCNNQWSVRILRQIKTGSCYSFLEEKDELQKSLLRHPIFFVEREEWKETR